ncbi:alpha/beta hydrolase [Planctomycetes bacterium K23_9]|uniref:Carboxylesterase NlhH n=1 Tax=Stieleria marina TaxID=1930275 RepID=A0A517NRL4_9BACT|nr:Carboxylesterase NlhH [Planctomycetes bacterium K23_9]
MKSTFTFLLLTVCFSLLSSAETIKHDFKGDATAEVFKKASGDDLWIYRFDPVDHDAKSDKRPAVVFFFGGGWNGGQVTQFEQHAKYLAARGAVTFVADYRVKSRQKTGPDACVADGKSAIRWVRKNAARFGIDPNRIAAGGGSAGGHVAATTGICDGLDDPADSDSDVSSKSNALLLFNPVYDNGPDGYGHERAKKWFPAISPAHNITKDDPPTIVFLGSKDQLIPVSTAKKFDADLRAAGVKSEVWIYDGQPHGFFNESKSKKSFLDTVLKMDAFLVSIGWLQRTADEAKLHSLLRKKPS